GRRWAGRAGRTLEGRVPSWPAGVVAGTLCRGGTRHSRGRVCWCFARPASSRWNSTFPGSGLLVFRAVCFVEVELDIPGGGFVGSSRGLLCRGGTRHSQGVARHSQRWAQPSEFVFNLILKFSFPCR